MVDGTVRAMTTLSVRDHMTLSVESRRWKYAGAKEEHIRVTFGESAVRYYQRLDVLLDHPDAERQHPMLVRRLRRLRDLRRDVRAAPAPVGFRRSG